MGIIAKSTGGDFEQVPTGSFIARCYRMVDIGTQAIVWGEDTKRQRQVYIYWELLEDEDGEPVRMKDGRPFSVSKRYTLSIHPKSNMRQDIDNWRGIPFTDEEAEAFDITKLLDAYCRVQVTRTENNGKSYTNVASVIFTKKKPEGVNVSSWWSVEEPDLTEYDKMPDWLKEKIASSEEWVLKRGTLSREDENKQIVQGANDAFGDEPINLDDIPA